MKDLKIPIDGKQTLIKLKELDVDQLDLDGSNPRIGFFRDNQPNETLTEEQVIFALTNKNPEAYQKLKDSIQNNRGIMNAIWVEPIKQKGKNKYKVIEGNSRVVAYRQLKDEEPFEKNWVTIISYILPKEIDESQRNFIRLQSHLRGTTPWDAYEKAKYLYKLWNDTWSISRLEKQTKMKKNEIENNIKAYKMMEEQYLPRHFNDPNEINKFSYFVEFIKDKKLQKVLKENLKTELDFCDWVADRDKLPRGEDVRMLRNIFENEDSRNVFCNNGFDAAIQVLELRKPNLTSKLYREIEDVIEELKGISAEEIDEIISEENSEKKKLIRELTKWSQIVLKMIEKGNGF